MGVGSSFKRKRRSGKAVAALRSFKLEDYSSARMLSLRIKLQWYIMKNNAAKCEEVLRSCQKADRLINLRFENSLRVFNTTPLHLACMYRKPSVLDLLLRYGADPYLRDGYGRFPAVAVVQCWRWVRSAHLEKMDRAEENRAVRFCFSRLADYGFDLSSVVNDGGETLLHLCARMNAHVPAQILVELGADKEALDVDGQTPLITASRHCSIKVVRRLVTLGADLDVRDTRGAGVLHHLCRKAVGEADLAWLVQHGANMGLRDGHGNSALHVAVLHPFQPGKTATLLRRGANPDAKNDDGQSCLHLLLKTFETPSERLVMHALFESVRPCVTDSKGRLPEPLLKEKNAGLRDLINSRIHSPPSLLLLSRKAVRRRLVSLGRLSPAPVSRLPLPPGLRPVVLDDGDYI